MNPKLFARAFSDIKKQSENEKSKKNITNRQQHLNKNVQQKKPIAEKEKEIVNDHQEKEDKQVIKKQEPLIKRISKQTKNATQQNIKRWRNDLHHKIQNVKDKQKLERTIFVQNSNYDQIIKVLKNYKIYIEEIKEHKVVLNDKQKMKQCYDALIKANLKARIGPQKQQINQVKHEQYNRSSKIFDRIK